jgi:hypothetical protein
MKFHYKIVTLSRLEAEALPITAFSLVGAQPDMV